MVIWNDAYSTLQTSISYGYQPLKQKKKLKPKKHQIFLQFYRIQFLISSSLNHLRNVRNTNYIFIQIEFNSLAKTIFKIHPYPDNIEVLLLPKYYAYCSIPLTEFQMKWINHEFE